MIAIAEGRAKVALIFVGIALIVIAAMFILAFTLQPS
jgi:hypothetical protein